MTEIGVIHVYNYEPKIRKITSMSAGYVDAYSRRMNRKGFLSLAVHPTKPYLLTVSGIEIKLWDGDKCWECIQIFRVLGSMRGPYPVAFNRMDTIAIASDVNKVEVSAYFSLYRNKFAWSGQVLRTFDFDLLYVYALYRFGVLILPKMTTRCCLGIRAR